MKSIINWLWNVFVAIDQLGNTLAGGNPDITMSARVGYFANKSQNRKFIYYWKSLEFVIDTAFYPIHGPKHCLKAFEKDIPNGHVHGSDFMRAVLGIFVVVGCSMISVITWFAYLIGYRPENQEA